MLSLPRSIEVDEVVVGLIIVVSDDSATPSNADDPLLLSEGDDARDLGLDERFQLLQVLPILEVPNFDGTVPRSCEGKSIRNKLNVDCL